MRLPISSAARLQRQRDALNRRRQALEDGIASIDADLAEIDRAEQILYAPQNGVRVKLPKILKEIKPTRKDMILGILKSRRRGSTRIEIADLLKSRKNIDISVDTVTVYLSQMKAEGLGSVKFHRELMTAAAR